MFAASLRYAIIKAKELPFSMPKIDIPLKRLIQRCYVDWVKFVQPGCCKEWVVPFKSEYVPRAESRLDDVFNVEDPVGSYLVNFEPMGYLDVTLPARMMRYRSDIWEATLADGKGTPNIRQIVLFFYPATDNKRHHLIDQRWEHIGVDYSYDVVRIWEVARHTVIERKLVGLYPLLPLMKGELEETEEDPRQVIQDSIRTVLDGVDDEALQQDLLAVMGILAGGKYTAGLVCSMIRREMVMQSPIYQEWVKEEREEAEVRGEARKARDAICSFLEIRFGAEVTGIRENVRQMNDLDVLDQVLKKVYAANTLEEAKTIIWDGIAKSLQ